jgi:hypothetical protein
LRCVAVEFEPQSDRLKPDWSLLADTEGAAKIEIAFYLHRAASNWNFECRRHRSQGHAGACSERLQEHVAGTDLLSSASRRWMKTSLNERTPGLHLAAYPRGVQAPGSF